MGNVYVGCCFARPTFGRQKCCGKNLDGVSIPKSKKERADVAISERLSLQSQIRSSNGVRDEERRGDVNLTMAIALS